MANSEYKSPTRIKWNEIEKVGHPPSELAKNENGADRQFLVRCEYSIEVAYLFHDLSGFGLPDESSGTAVAWAVVEGF